MTVRHVLLDADDVLQQGTSSFRVDLATVLGDEAVPWLSDTFHPDGDVLTGRAGVVPLLAERLAGLGRDDDAQALYDRVWLDITLHQPVLELVAGWRAAGLTVHLASNQDPGRTAYMKQALGYDAVLDGAYELLGSAVAVICHGGPGTIMDARDAGHVPVVWPRDPEHGEHVDGHQQRFVRLLGSSDLVVATWSTAEVDEAVAEALSGRGPAAGVTDTRATDAARAAVGRELDRIAGRDRSRRVTRPDAPVST